MKPASAALLCVFAIACGPGASAPGRPSASPGASTLVRKPQSVVLISIDALRADHLSAYGYQRETSPTLQVLAKQGAVFESAFSPTTWTLPGHASMLTGLTPFRHGASEDGRRIRDDVPLLAELMKGLGYHTAAVINSPYMVQAFGFGRGFDTFVERSHEDRELPFYQPLVIETARSMQEPFFLFVHYISVHDPYRPLPEFNRWSSKSGVGGLRQLAQEVEAGRRLSPEEAQTLIDLYDGEILSMDHQLSQLLESLKQISPDVLVIVTADHGEEFLDHGSLHHGHRLYDEVLRVPLIVSGPGVKPGVRIAEMASLVDILPTVVAWTGGPVPEGLDGVSLAGLLRGEASTLPKNRTLPLHTRGGDSKVHLWGLRTSTSKLIVDQQTGKKEFYDLVADPREQRNLYPTPEARRLERQLDNLTLAPSSRERVKHDKQRLEVLRSLGYR
jgi:choline-sulfatase